MLSNKVYTALQRGILAHLWQLWMGQGAVNLFWACDLLDLGFTHSLGHLPHPRDQAWAVRTLLSKG